MFYLLRYFGRRAETLRKYDNPSLRSGPYDFSKGEAEVDEKDAEVMIRDNPQAFSILGALTQVANTINAVADGVEETAQNVAESVEAVSGAVEAVDTAGDRLKASMKNAGKTVGAAAKK